jgi:two-component system CheB/CheR fusion protein
MKITESRQPKKTNQNFPVVGIGASAGGLDALKRL